MRPVRRLIVHASATRPEWMHNRTLAEQVAEIRRWHVEGRGWRDIGYHLLIGRSGRIAAGRPLRDVGAHVIGHNHDSVGVCLIGGHASSADDRPGEHFTPEQMAALGRVVLWARFLRPGLTVHGHNEFAAKACPGFRVRKWMEGLSDG